MERVCVERLLGFHRQETDVCPFLPGLLDANGRSSLGPLEERKAPENWRR